MTSVQRLIVVAALLLATVLPAYHPRHSTTPTRLVRLQRWLTGRRARRVTRGVMRRWEDRQRAWARAEDVRLEAWAHTLNVGWGAAC